MEKDVRFSFGWFVVATIFHILVTIALCGVAFVVGMGAFTTGTGHEADFLLWTWNPLGMALNVENSKGRNWAGDWIVPAGLAWSMIVGIGAGFYFRWRSSKKVKASDPESW